MMKANMKHLLMALLGLLFFLLLSHNPCYAKSTTVLRGPNDVADDANDALLLLQATLEQLLHRVSSLEQDQVSMRHQITALQEENKELKERLQQSEELHQQHERRLQNSCIANDSLANGAIFIDNCNLHIRSGMGTTDQINGRGNLIVGYNEADAQHSRTGSHNIVVGTAHDWRSHSGIVSGRSNDINGAATAVIGGHNNAVDGGGSTIVGGSANVVRGDMGHLSGGANNVVVGFESAVFGGSQNTASAQGSVVVGGKGNTGTGVYSTLIG